MFDFFMGFMIFLVINYYDWMIFKVCNIVYDCFVIGIGVIVC